MTNQVTRQALAQDIKREIMADLQSRNTMHPEAQMSIGQIGMGQMGNYNIQKMDSAMVQAIKRDVIAQIEAEQEAREEMMQHNYAQQQSSQQKAYNFYPDRMMVDTIKREVMAHLRNPYNDMLYPNQGNQDYSYGQLNYQGTKAYSYDPALIETIKRDVMAQMKVGQ